MECFSTTNAKWESAPVSTIDSMQKCENKIKGKRFSVWSKESFLFLSGWEGNVINGGTTKKEGKNFEISVGGSKGRETRFWLKFSGGGNLGGSNTGVFHNAKFLRTPILKDVC